MARIVRVDRELEMLRVDAELRRAGHDLVLVPENTDLVPVIGEADLLLMCYTPVTAQVIDAARKLRGVVKYGVGIDAIDIPAARRRGIPVVNIPAYAEETVAEGAFALLMALAKKLKPLQKAMEKDGWAWPTQQWLGIDLAGKTVGVIGMGRIGSAFARMATAFRMRVLSVEKETKAEELRATLAQCDFVSIHCVLNDSTRGLIGDAELRAMKPTAFLINVSRGAIVDEMALLKALREKRIAGAALDVFSVEPLTSEHPLHDMDNVILSPHLTFYTQEAMERLEKETLERCFEILEGGPVTVKSRDPRLRAQERGVRFLD